LAVQSDGVNGPVNIVARIGFGFGGVVAISSTKALVFTVFVHVYAGKPIRVSGGEGIVVNVRVPVPSLRKFLMI